MEYEYIVIGAGSAGLSFAALMEKKGHTVCVLEAHSNPGGCSSYFERDGFIFDAGATTLSGMLKGRPLQKLIHELELNLNIVKIDPGIVSLINNKKVNRYSDPVKWVDELNKNFPHNKNKEFWNDLREIEKRGWLLSTNFKNIPLRSFKSLISFFSPHLISALKTTPELFKSIAGELDKFEIKDPEYLSMLDEMLFITAQNHREDTPLLMGAMGLCYPEDTSYAIGGMKAFSEALAEKCSHILYKHEVQKIVPIEEGFLVQTKHNELRAKKVVSTIPSWNHVNLFDDLKAKEFFSKSYPLKNDNCWSAFMIYLTIPIDSKRESLYYQIHCSSIPHCQTKSFFVSLSHPDDKLRSHSGRQVVTISTHTKSFEWLDQPKDIYKAKKDETAAFILENLKTHFNLKDEDLRNIITASPKSFIKYTRRYNGLVGGIPHSVKRNPLDYVLARSPVENFYMLGDTQFPGQGIAAVVMGSMNLVDYLNS